ncbi:Glycolipid transfer protein (GLTP) [Musa troglodytarum]|uniref:Glycolipid transfer protein (GLTP) n=1 Tax=Musa troglodytarum TaxID=320322 RepID=A0A9E7EBZ5_9LILI|nr:Glycolipid transfer protein (GLTP) [Musa troglodytarum]URD74409.1 Glycolipid transfer protein (GLTP) [Musa troglodytarum]
MEQSKRNAGLEMRKGEGEEDGRRGWSDVRLAMEELSLFKPEEKKVSTLALLGASNLILHVLDKIGPTLLVLRQDIQQNIERVEEMYMLNPNLYSSLVEMVKKEVCEGSSRNKHSCSRAILWLARSITFSVTLFQKLDKNPESSLAQVVEETYNDTLKPWHGWVASAAYKVAIMLVPEREIFIRLLMGQGQDYDGLKQDIKIYVSVIYPLLDETYALLRTHKLDTLKSS